MLQKLQQKWKVGTGRLLLILTSFALGGSLCGWLGRKLLGLWGLEKSAAYYILYVVVITILWPLCVLVIGSGLGQFRFFRNYLSKILAKITGQKPLAKLVVFGSGGGTNAEKIMEYFEHHSSIKVKLIVTNRKNAGILAKAQSRGIATIILTQQLPLNSQTTIDQLQKQGITHIILAGFLQKIPPSLLNAFPKIINIHPALLPAYGGKGMYGHHVHQAVVQAGEQKTGITIHEVDEVYDHGKILYRQEIPISKQDTAGTVAEKVLVVEHEQYPKVIEQWIKGKL